MGCDLSKRRLVQFRLSTGLLTITICALALGWWKDRSDLTRQLSNRTAIDHALAMANGFKQHQWRVSDHLGQDTNSVEQELRGYVNDPSGEMGSSRGIGGEIRLRRPSTETFRRVIALLDHGNAVVRYRAAKALALYGEALHSRPWSRQELDTYEPMTRQAVSMLLPLLSDSSAEIRGVAALALGELAAPAEGMPALINAFQHEDESTAKLYMSWAIRKLFYQ
jgi:hypothetical protein